MSLQWCLRHSTQSSQGQHHTAGHLQRHWCQAVHCPPCRLATVLLANAAAEAGQAPALDLEVSVQPAALQLCPVAQMCSNWVPGCSDVEDPQKDLVDPALKGTRNVMNAAAKSKASVKRVVLTSSFAGGAMPDCASIALLCLETEGPVPGALEYSFCTGDLAAGAWLLS